MIVLLSHELLQIFFQVDVSTFQIVSALHTYLTQIKRDLSQRENSQNLRTE